jgi:hypothetical protein
LLGLTVHSLPAAQASDAIDAAERSRSGRIKMFLVLLVRPRGLLGERIEKFE